MGGHNLPPLVEVGLTDLPKSGGGMTAPPGGGHDSTPGTPVDDRPARAVGKSENPGVPVLFGGYNLPTLVEIGLTDLPKSGGGAWHPHHPHGRHPCNTDI